MGREWCEERDRRWEGAADGTGELVIEESEATGLLRCVCVELVVVLSTHTKGMCCSNMNGDKHCMHPLANSPCCVS